MLWLLTTAGMTDWGSVDEVLVVRYQMVLHGQFYDRTDQDPAIAYTCPHSCLLNSRCPTVCKYEVLYNCPGVLNRSAGMGNTVR